MEKTKVELGLVLMFLFCFFGEILTFPDTWILIGESAICAALYARQNKIRVDIPTCLLAITVILYIGMDKSFGIASITPLTYVIPLIFMMMNYLAAEIKKSSTDDNLIILLILVMTIGLTFHGLLNSYMWLDKQWLNGVFRIWKDFWSGEYKYAAWQNSYYLPAMALVLPAIIYFKKRKIINGFIILSACFFLYISLISESRVTALMFPLVLVIQSVVYVVLEKNQLTKNINKKFFVIGIVLGGLVLIGAGIIFLNSSVGQGFLEIMGRDGGIFNNVRFKFQRKALGQIFKYPFGGRKMDFMGYGHAHNAWIDIADAGGVIPFFTFVNYTIYTMFDLGCILKKREVTTELKLMVIGVYIVFALFFMIESALESYGRYILPWIFMHGLVHGYVANANSENADVE